VKRFSAAEKRAAAEREAAMRRGFYRKQVAAGRMTQAAADQGIAIMDEIAQDYREQDGGER